MAFDHGCAGRTASAPPLPAPQRRRRPRRCPATTRQGRIRPSPAGPGMRSKTLRRPRRPRRPKTLRRPRRPKTLRRPRSPAARRPRRERVTKCRWQSLPSSYSRRCHTRRACVTKCGWRRFRALSPRAGPAPRSDKGAARRCRRKSRGSGTLQSPRRSNASSSASDRGGGRTTATFRSIHPCRPRARPMGPKTGLVRPRSFG